MARSRSTPLWHDGRAWATFWIVALTFMAAWSVATVLWLMDSVPNLNALSIAANLMATLGGLQASLAMRKADDHDDY